MLPVKQFINFIEQNKLFNNLDSILVAVSGGMDSVLLANLIKASGYNFAVAHCNFQLRGEESNADQQFCQNLAQQLEAPFHVISFDTLAFAETNKISVQMAARELRYQWFEQIRQQFNYSVIALAHHQNDAIETILLNLVRGTGIAGLHGILPKSGVLVRPLMFMTREDVQHQITENNLAYVEDSSNASAKYARNKIRLEVIPKLKELNQELEQTFEKNLLHFRSLEILLNNKVQELKKALFLPFGDEIHISIDELKKLVPKQLLIFNLFKDFGFNETAINDLEKALYKHSGRIFYSETYQILIDRSNLVLSKKVTNLPEQVTFEALDHQIDFGAYRLKIVNAEVKDIVTNDRMKASIDSDKIIYPLTLRNWKEGDFFYPIGMNSRKKLSDFFINQKIALNKKTEIPLLVNGNNEIIWIGGYRPDDRYKITENSKNVTIFELSKI